jgi:hypothetical protein
VVNQMIQINLSTELINKLDGVLIFLLWGLAVFDLIRYFPNPSWEPIASLLFLIMLRVLFFARLPDAWGLTGFSDLMDGPVVKFVTYFAGIELTAYGLWQRHVNKKRPKAFTEKDLK